MPESAAMERRTKDKEVLGSESQMQPDQKLVTCILTDSQERPSSRSEIPGQLALARTSRFRWNGSPAFPRALLLALRSPARSECSFDCLRTMR
jgi:hypothetical protein